MSKSLILVTGATGKTGSAVVRQLLDLGYPVRATVRGRDERADALEALGAEAVVADFHDLSSMRDALQDVTSVAELNVRPDDAVGAYLNVPTNAGARCDNGGEVYTHGTKRLHFETQVTSTRRRSRRT